MREYTSESYIAKTARFEFFDMQQFDVFIEERGNGSNYLIVFDEAADYYGSFQAVVLNSMFDVIERTAAGFVYLESLKRADPIDAWHALESYARYELEECENYLELYGEKYPYDQDAPYWYEVMQDAKEQREFLERD